MIDFLKIGLFFLAYLLLVARFSTGEYSMKPNRFPKSVHEKNALIYPPARRLYSASAALYLGLPPLVAPQSSKIIFALP